MKSRLEKMEKRLKKLMEAETAVYVKLSDNNLYKLTKQGLVLATDPPEGTRIQVFDCNKEHLIAFVAKGTPHFIQVQSVSQMLSEQ